MSIGRKKNIITPEFAKELKNIFSTLENKGFSSDSKIAIKLALDRNTIGRWRRLEIAPEKNNLKRLRQLAEGTLPDDESISNSNPSMGLRDEVIRFQGKTEVLLNQILQQQAADLVKDQELILKLDKFEELADNLSEEYAISMGAVKAKLDALEIQSKAAKELSQKLEVRLESKIDDLSKTMENLTKMAALMVNLLQEIKNPSKK